MESNKGAVAIEETVKILLAVAIAATVIYIVTNATGATRII